MPFSYVVHQKLGLVVSTGRGCLSWGEIRACQDQALADPDFSPRFNQIADLRAGNECQHDIRPDYATGASNGLQLPVEACFCGVQCARLRRGTNVGNNHRAFEQSVTNSGVL